MKWDLICKPKEEGGLGVKDLEKFNWALLGKWTWRLLQEDHKLWSKIIRSKYKRRTTTSIRNHSIWWRDLNNITNNSSNDNWFWNGVRRIIGNGEKISFWNDNWIGNEPLHLRFSRLFSLSLDKESVVANMGEWRGSEWKWNLTWRRSLFVWEEQLAQELHKLLEGASLSQEKKTCGAGNGTRQGNTQFDQHTDNLMGVILLTVLVSLKLYGVQMHLSRL